MEQVPVWGGIECTVHRIGNEYGNQLVRSGHHERIEDLKLIAELGVKTLRYPILWETVAPEGLSKANWSWIDERLDTLKTLGITPIAGLLHHGSGPKSTSLIDPAFPEKFTEFAIAVAERYPWLEYFTPINEPLTTARFSCLYGHWYPQLKDDKIFCTALFNECKATIMAMRAIQRVIPNAKLVQTEDLGKCHSTEQLQYQRNFENARRWISIDLLTGRWKGNYPMKGYFSDIARVDEDALAYFEDNSFKPDIIGVNYYITSERYLDHHYEKYPAWSHASNGRDRYADVEVVRADIYKRAGHYELLKEAYDRYNLPVALTEVHMGATRDEQMRWFMEGWCAANTLKQEGVPVKGVTAWSLLGAYDWNSLLTRKDNFYEPGVFDVRSGTPRPTALATLIQTLSQGSEPGHPVLGARGWWENPGTVNIMFGTQQEARELPTIEGMDQASLPSPTAKPVLITGATGTLGQAFARICSFRNISYVLLSRQEMDIANSQSVERMIEKFQPWAIINTAGFVKVDEAEVKPHICFRENAEGPAVLARACRKYGIAFLTFSTDFVFDGARTSPYREKDDPRPLNIYGTSKWQAERSVLAINPASLVIRTSSFFGPWDQHNFLSNLVNALDQQKPFFTSADYVVSPTYVPDLVNACLDLIIDESKGIWHLSNPSAITWVDLAYRTAEMAQLQTDLIRAADPRALGFTAVRPAYSVLSSERGIILPPLDDAIARFLRERQAVLV